MKVELLNIFKEGIRTENEDVCVRNLNYGYLLQFNTNLTLETQPRRKTY